jgi:hypothetical protein
MKIVRITSRSFFDATVLTLLSISVISVGWAQVRTSSNYQLQSDSVNIGGGLSSSTNYTQESTVGEVATGDSDGSTYSLRAGYQQMQEVYLSLTTTGDTALVGDGAGGGVGGITGGSATGTTAVNVVTDSPSGYSLTIQASNDPAMQGENGTIADYDAGAEPDFAFTVGAGEAYFGFSPEGSDIVQAFQDSVGACNSAGGDTSLACWDGLDTTETTIAAGAGSNHPSGATTTVQFRLELGTNAGVLAGMYTATATVTALPL